MGLGMTDCAVIEKEALVSIVTMVATQAFDRVMPTSFAMARGLHVILPRLA